MRGWSGPLACAGMAVLAVGTGTVALPASAAAVAVVQRSSFLATTDPGTASTTLKDVRTIVNASTGTAASLNGSGVGIALVDTGLAPVAGLPAAQLVNGPDLSFESQSSTLRYLDTYGHGTHMAGIMVANDSATGTVGISPKAKITSVKVGNADGAADVSQMIAAIDWVVANRNHDPANSIRVLNLSYGSGGTPASTSDPLQFAVEQAWKAGIVVVVAAGNDGNASTLLNDPATDPYVLAVGSASTKGTTATADDELSPYSNLSTTRTADILAPGDGIVSLRDPGSNIDETYPAARVGDTLFRGSGTSQAAAVVSATVALLLQQRPTLTPDQVKKLLKDTGTPIKVGTGAAKGLKELNLGAAIAQPASATAQLFAASTGTGSIEAARGTSHVTRDGVALSGDRTIFGPFSSAAWAVQSSLKTAWAGGLWLGNRMAGDTWTGPNGSVATGQIAGPNGQCLDLEGGNNTNGVQMQLYPCNNTLGQSWTLASDGTVRILGKCLTVQSDLTANGSRLEIWDCDGRPTQTWHLTADREIVNNLSNRCIDTTSGVTTSMNGTRLQIWDCNKTAAQRWMPPFASQTWGAATWSGQPWSGASSWIDPTWSGTYWTGHYWSGHYWSGHYWSGSGWSTSSWS